MSKYMEDCIHLKACRRLCVLSKSLREMEEEMQNGELSE